jgi:hypothetical protein
MRHTVCGDTIWNVTADRWAAAFPDLLGSSPSWSVRRKERIESHRGVASTWRGHSRPIVRATLGKRRSEFDGMRVWTLFKYQAVRTTALSRRRAVPSGVIRDATTGTFRVANSTVI